MAHAKTSSAQHQIARVEARLFRLPVEPPRGDAIQKFEALELPLVQITDGTGRVGAGFGYTIGTGGAAILELLRKELIDWLPGKDARRISFIHEYLHQSIHALTPGCISSAALAAIDIALWDLAGKRTQTVVIPRGRAGAGLRSQVSAATRCILPRSFKWRSTLRLQREEAEGQKK